MRSREGVELIEELRPIEMVARVCSRFELLLSRSSRRRIADQMYPIGTICVAFQ